MRPALQVEYERNLAVVDRAIAATRSAAKSNPNDPDAADFMFAAYQSKVDLLNTIADARARRRSRTLKGPGSKLTKKLFAVCAVAGLILSLAGSTQAHDEKTDNTTGREK